MNAPAHVPTSPAKLRLRVEDYLLLNDGGAFDDYAKTELIDGDIYVMNAQHSPHARTKSRLLVAFANRLLEMGSELEAISEVAVHLNGDSMPEPDIVLTGWRGKGAVPLDSVALLVEVADTTLGRDLGRKRELYAAARVAEYWVVDVNEGRVLMHDDPIGNGYATCRDAPLGETLVAATIAGLAVDGAELIR